MKKIDIHCHTTNRKVRDVISESCTLETIAEEMQKYEIEKTIVLATYFPHRGSGITNFRLRNWIDNHGNSDQKNKFQMFGSLDFNHYFWQGLNELEEMAERELMAGIKIYTCYQEIDLASEKFRQVTDIANKHSLPMMFHCGNSYSMMRKFGRSTVTDKPVKASNIELLAKENPYINFVISHLSKPFLDDVIRTAIANPNIYSDMSGLIDSKFDREEIPNSVEMVKRYVNECGPGKMLFGTDFPVQTHEDSIYFVEEGMKHFSEQEKEDVYYNNVRKLLKCQR